MDARWSVFIISVCLAVLAVIIVMKGRGSQGPEGPVGKEGDRGDRGDPLEVEGPQGLMGLKGLAGKSIPGRVGPQGSVGLPTEWTCHLELKNAPPLGTITSGTEPNQHLELVLPSSQPFQPLSETQLGLVNAVTVEALPGNRANFAFTMFQ